MSMMCLSWWFTSYSSGRRSVPPLLRRCSPSAAIFSPQAKEELVESGVSGETVRKSRLAGQPGVTERARSSLSAGVRRAELGRC